ncbi:hypothetical protein TNCV_1660911 [Trichonephila clavipes]|nr:hypothetical protein TNCV_1660911 [Trichonephila clavipes]
MRNKTYSAFSVFMILGSKVHEPMFRTGPSLPASPQASRPETPQDLDATSSNCQDLLRAATEIKALAPSIELVHSQISNLITQGMTDPDDPVILEKSQLLERLNGYYQQAMSHFTSLPPCDIPNCTRHTPTNTPVRDDQTESPLPKPTSSKRKENNDGFISPPLRKLNKNQDTTTDTETTFKIDLTNKFNALEKQTTQTHKDAETHIIPHNANTSLSKNTKNPTPATVNLPPPPMLQITNDFRTHMQTIANKRPHIRSKKAGQYIKLYTDMFDQRDELNNLLETLKYIRTSKLHQNH